jgi:uncharacterized membrane protein YdjX (TVP38/TMEM64 family)
VLNLKPSARPWLLLAAVLLVATLLLAAWHWGGGLGSDVRWLQAQQQKLLQWQAASPWWFGIGFFALFVTLSALAVPGCSLLALAAGLCFGLVGGTVVVVVASTVGATGAFLAARHVLRERLQQRWAARMAWLQRRVQADGALALFSLRLAPLVPFWLLNPVMGLTRMGTGRFFVVSLLGMVPGSAAYVQAGCDLARWADGGHLWSPSLVAALLTLALVPWLGRWLWQRGGKPSVGAA